jgi:predicted nucleic acid-binding protein
VKESFIVDCSVALAWVFGSQATDHTRELLIKQKGGATLVVPSLWYYEVANGLVVGLRRKLLTADNHAEALAFFNSLRITRDDEGVEKAFSISSTLSQRYGLTVYDASYLELALRRKIPLATRDVALQGAARKCGVELL